MKRTFFGIAAALIVLGPIVAILARSGDGQARLVLARAANNTPGMVVEAPTTSTTAPTPTTVAVAAPRAQPTTTRVPHPRHDAVVFDEDPLTVGRQALQLITYPWDNLNVTMVFAGPNPSMRARTDIIGDQHQITAFVRPTDTPRTVAISVAHEIGHLIDFERLTDADRQEWLRERGRPDAAWWTCNWCDDFGVGSGDFAETFAAWEAGPFDYRSQLAPLPSPAEMQSLSGFFNR